MSEYRGVSEKQGPPAANASAPAAGSSPGAPVNPPVKPVIPAAAAKRANASVIGMIIALAVSIAAFLPIVLMNPAPKSDGFRPDINVSAVARNAEDVAGFTPVAPELGESFSPNYARWESGTASGVATWEVGYVTPRQAFIGLAQTAQANPTWLLEQVKSAPVTGKRNAGGLDWELRDSGKGQKSMILVHRGTTVVLTGTAQLDEFSVLAAAVVKSLNSNPAATVSRSAAPSP